LASGSQAELAARTDSCAPLFLCPREAVSLLVDRLLAAFNQILSRVPPFIALVLQIIRRIAQIPSHFVAGLWRI
jgi:hypothetical protein